MDKETVFPLHGPFYFEEFHTPKYYKETVVPLDVRREEILVPIFTLSSQKTIMFIILQKPKILQMLLLWSWVKKLMGILQSLNKLYLFCTCSEGRTPGIKLGHRQCSLDYHKTSAFVLQLIKYEESLK
jgi:hypothetical protein